MGNKLSKDAHCKTQSTLLNIFRIKMNNRKKASKDKLFSSANLCTLALFIPRPFLITRLLKAKKTRKKL